MCDRLLKTPINGFRALLEKVQTKLDISKQKKNQSKQKKKWAYECESEFSVSEKPSQL